MKQFTPHPYQLRGMELLVSGPAALLLDPGMGKTPTTLGAFNTLNKKWDYRMLVVAPLRPMYETWPAECAKWEDFAHLRCTILHGKNKVKELASTKRHNEQDIVLINPEGLMWYLENTMPEDRPEILCIDESTKFKSSQSKRFKRLRKELYGFDYRWILTGTFAPNGLMDLWAQMFIVDEGEGLGKYISHYREEYFRPVGWGGYTYEPKEESAARIAETIAPMVLRLNATDHLDMPDLVNITRTVKLSTAAMKTYKKVEEDFIIELSEGTVIASNAAAAGTKCRQIANGACYLLEGHWTLVHDEKLKALDELVEETNGAPLLVVYEFKHDLERLQEYFGKRASTITGASRTALKAAVDGFNGGRIPALLAHAGSLHGLNIQGSCRHMVWFGITWSLENYQQAVWRIYRQGQQAESVMVYHIVAEETLDEVVVKVLGNKEATQTMLHNHLLGEIK